MPEHDQTPPGTYEPYLAEDEYATQRGYDATPGAVGPAILAPSGGRRRRRRRASGCLPILLVLAVLAGLGYLGVTRGIDALDSAFADPEDYDGPGIGATTFRVTSGDSISIIADNLERLDVVASAEAFVDAAAVDDRSAGIREGVYRVREQMSAAETVDLLVSARTRGSQFTFTAGKTVEEIVDLLVADTELTRRELQSALDRPAQLDLPRSAEGSAEGYLAPGSYTFFPDDDATTILSEMVESWRADAEEVGLSAAAERIGYSEHDLMTIASLVQTEGSLLDERGRSRIARVIYNRLEIEDNPSAGFLQLDATVNYALGEKVARLTFAQIDSVADSPYNTYSMQGLPPGPIATPSLDALRAAIEPAEGPWFYYVTVNLRTGETKFATTPEEFSVLRAELDDYCDTQSDRC